MATMWHSIVAKVTSGGFSVRVVFAQHRHAILRSIRPASTVPAADVEAGVQAKWPSGGCAGFIGLGAMGYFMAGNVAKTVLASGSGSKLLVWNRTAATADRHAAEFGSCKVRELTEMSECRVIFSCLPTSDEVAATTSKVAKARIAVGVTEPCVWVDCTSGDPEQTRSIADRLALEGGGIQLVDCPVSGGPSGAVAGRLTAMLGGEHEVTLPAVPLIQAFAKTIQHCGPVGSGMAIKAVNNALNSAHLLLATEGLLALKALGVDPAVALATINSSSGRSMATEVRIPEQVLSRRFFHGFKLGLMKKDCEIASALIKSGFPEASLLLHAVSNVGNATEARGQDVDYTELSRWLEDKAGIELAKESS
eukprot:gnl/TRDRNA2_/TRDRNA2_90928_c0_seq1.p1 gnl/TRDRNA2_/TRDRNA2_90928_c0~~gnl/TRDRNA2_/TRDRNA2_90928_c0_seq1.p1  ORF type:complete len:365 (+),score=51.78 gnl/TRDRNA2_/TRDRNA2_90928_c0_seq1:59-1153(+)